MPPPKYDIYEIDENLKNPETGEPLPKGTTYEAIYNIANRRDDNGNIIGELRSACYSPHFVKVIGIAMMKKPHWEVSQRNCLIRWKVLHFAFQNPPKSYQKSIPRCIPSGASFFDQLLIDVCSQLGTGFPRAAQLQSRDKHSNMSE